MQPAGRVSREDDRVSQRRLTHGESTLTSPSLRNFLSGCAGSDRPRLGATGSRGTYISQLEANALESRGTINKLTQWTFFPVKTSGCWCMKRTSRDTRPLSHIPSKHVAERTGRYFTATENHPLTALASRVGSFPSSLLFVLTQKVKSEIKIIVIPSSSVI